MTHICHKPRIAITQSDFARLSLLAEILARRNSDLADPLSSELARAELIDEAMHEREVVRMGSTLDYETEPGDARTVTLVFPQDEDISSGRISILTPIGVALIGLSAGDSMEWRRRDGGTRRLKVTRILTPSPTPAESAPNVALVS